MVGFYGGAGRNLRGGFCGGAGRNLRVDPIKLYEDTVITNTLWVSHLQLTEESGRIVVELNFWRKTLRLIHHKLN